MKYKAKCNNCLNEFKVPEDWIETENEHYPMYGFSAIIVKILNINIAETVMSF